MSHLTKLVAVASAIALVSCGEEKATAPEPTAPAAAQRSPAPAPSTLVGTGASKGSSICRGYQARRNGLSNAIAKANPNAPGIAKQKAQVAALDVIIKDACQ